MAGSHRRRRRRARPPQPESSPPAPTTLGPREVAVAGRPYKTTCHASGSTSSPSSGPHVWADLLDSMLHQIIALFSSFHDFLAFAGTCRSWRAAASSFPSVYSFTFPPLHLKPDDTPPLFGLAKYSLLSACKWQLGDPAKRALSLCCSVTRNTPNRMRYMGCSYGYLIFSCWEHCLLVNAYTGTKVKPPKLRSNSKLEIYYGILMAPLNSPNWHLLLCSRTSMFQWQVGSNSWSEHPLAIGGERILQIVFFKGELFAMDFLQRLHTIRFGPQLIMQEVAVVWGDDMIVGLLCKPWLVICGDMLLMVDRLISIDHGFSGTFQVFLLDFSVEPAKWVKIEKLENWALFVSLDRRNPTFSCMSPERWGGKSNCIYVASASEDSDEAWTPVELGQAVPGTAVAVSYTHRPPPNGHCDQLANLWLLPSLVYGAGQ